MNRHGPPKLMITFMLGIIGLSAFAQVTPAAILSSNSWTMTGLLKDWLITPYDLAINGNEIYVSSYLDGWDSELGWTDFGRFGERYSTVKSLVIFRS